MRELVYQVCSKVLMRIAVVCLLMGLFACEEALIPDAPAVTALPPVQTLVVGVADGAVRVLEGVDYFRPNLTLTHPSTNDLPLLADLDAGLLDAALVHYIPEDGVERWFNPVALDGIVPIVHPDNRLEGLTRAQLQALFTGTVTDWAALGGAGPVQVVSQHADAGTSALFQQFVLRELRLSINAEIRPNPAAVINAVANNPNAIGYVTIGSLPSDALVKVLTVDAIAATPTTLGTQEYPLTLPIYWVSATEPQGELRGVLSYLQSIEWQEMLGERFGRIR